MLGFDDSVKTCRNAPLRRVGCVVGVPLPSVVVGLDNSAVVGRPVGGVGDLGRGIYRDWRNIVLDCDGQKRVG